MATSAQILANRQNAALSTGPRTPEGKQASADNATKHGLSSQFSVLPYENHQEFETMRAAFRAEFDPRTPNEEFLVEQMLQARWRIARIYRLEAAVFEQLAESQTGESADARIAAALIQSSGLGALNVLQRYLAAAERSYHKAARELAESRKDHAIGQAVHTLDDSIARIVSAPLPGAGGYPESRDLGSFRKSAPPIPNVRAPRAGAVPRHPAPAGNPALRL
jgi:hypothetical protein